MSSYDTKKLGKGPDVQSVKGDAFHGVDKHNAKGPSSKSMKILGRNLARAKNQKG